MSCSDLIRVRESNKNNLNNGHQSDMTYSPIHRMTGACASRPFWLPALWTCWLLYVNNLKNGVILSHINAEIKIVLIVIMWSNFPQNIHKRHPIARLLGRAMGCLLWIQPLIHILPKFLQVLKLMVVQLPLATQNWAGPVRFDPGQIKIIIDYIRRVIFWIFLGD